MLKPSRPNAERLKILNYLPEDRYRQAGREILARLDPAPEVSSLQILL